MNRIGEHVGPYQLESLLSEGDGVALYLAIRPEGSREPRVVQIRLVEPPGDERAAAIIRNEYEVLRHLNDSRIPRTHGFYASQPALSIGHHQGVSLSEIIRLWRDEALSIDVPTAMDILMEIAQALRSAHPVRREGSPIIHGHLGSHTILLTPSGRVVVQGFGASPRGTFAAFTPPEQAAAAFMDARSDQWALGAIGVELLLGERLYTGVPDRREAALNGSVEPWLTMLEHRFPAASRVLGRMLSAAAGERYSSDSELIADLLALSRQASGPADRARLGSTAWTLMHADPDPAPTQPDASLSRPPADSASAPPATPPSATVQLPSEEAPTVAQVTASPAELPDASEAATVNIAAPQPAAAQVSSSPAPGSGPDPVPDPVLVQAPLAPTGPSLAGGPAISSPPSGPSLVSTPSEESLEPTELIAPDAEPEIEADQPAPAEPQKPSIDEAMEELKTSEMAAFIMVGVLVLVAIIFLAVRYS